MCNGKLRGTVHPVQDAQKHYACRLPSSPSNLLRPLFHSWIMSSSGCNIWVWSQLKWSTSNSMKHGSQSRVGCLVDPLTQLWLDLTPARLWLQVLCPIILMQPRWPNSEVSQTFPSLTKPHKWTPNISVFPNHFGLSFLYLYLSVWPCPCCSNHSYCTLIVLLL